MIEEAIFILKENVSDKMLDAKIELAKSESELILQNYIDGEIEDSVKRKFEVEKENKNNKNKKILAVILAIVFSIIVNKF